MTADMYLTQLKILYVEDDDDTRENLKQYLRKKAGKVVTAADGAEGLRKYEEEKPDIVIADLLMPGLSGMEMLKRIRAQGRQVSVYNHLVCQRDGYDNRSSGSWDSEVCAEADNSGQAAGYTEQGR